MIEKLNERITIEKSTVVTDKVGNHRNTWEEYFTCFAYASTYQAQEEEGEVTAEQKSVVFTVRWCSETTENARTGRRRYQNVDIKYKAFFFNGLPAKTAAVKAWLLSPIGYQKLQDTYDPDFFRMAVCKDALAFDVTAQKAAEMELTFNCKPQRWSVDGQRVIRLDGRSTLKNPFAFPAQPIFKVYGDSGGELYVGEEKITIHSIKDYVLLNCETHNAYNASGFCNETILSDDFPELPEGKTQITWTGGITAVEVTPRWWTL